MRNEERNRKRGSRGAGPKNSRFRGMLRLLPWLFCLFMLWPAAAGADASVVNGDFSIANPADPNFGWTREGAAVIDVGAAQLDEGGSQFASLSQRFTITPGTPSLSIVLLSLQFAPNAMGEAPDALQIQLLDGQGNSVAGVARDSQGNPLTGTQALLTLQQTGELCYSQKVSIAGAGVPVSGGVWSSPALPAVVTIDLSHITTSTPATVVIELLSFGGGGSSVRIDNVQTVAFPVAVNDSATTPEDTPVGIGVLANDTDFGGMLIPATVTVAAAPAHGTAAAQADGTIRYAPAANYCGADSFTYTVRDNDGNLSNAATVAVTVSCVDDPPSANAGRDQSVTAGNSVTLDGSGFDPEGSALTYLWEQIGAPAVTLSGTTVAKPTFTAPPVEPAGAQLTFRLTVTDAGQLSSSDTVVISVAQAGFTPPRAVDDSASTAEDTPAVIDLLQNDTAAAGTTLNRATVQIIVPPSHGGVVLNAQTGAATYTPAANYFGSDAFTYKVTDFKGLVSNEALVQLTITAVNDPPAANAGPDQSVTAGATVTLSGAASSDTEGAIASYLWEQTGGSAVTLSNPAGVQTTFAVPTSFEGSLTFLLTVTDSGGLQSTDTVAVQVIAAGLFPPVANPDSATTAEDTPVVIGLLANDTSTPAGSLNPATVAVVTPPSRGAVVLNAQTGAATYTPALNSFGSDAFTYQVRDNAGTLSNAAAVTVTITAVNDPPVANAGLVQSVREEFIVTLDGSASRDVEDAALIYLWTQTGGTPTVTLSDAGAAKPTFTAPNVGPEGAILTFQLKVTDSGGLFATDAVTVRIANAVIPCDVNDDKAVNLADAVLLLRAMAGRPAATPMLLAADVNGDQLLGMPEVICALQTAAGLRSDPNRDADGDGFTPRQGDCNDNSAAIHPGANEICNGIDDNCNGLIDEGLPQIPHYRDADGDGYGDPNSSFQSCQRPGGYAGYVTNNTDCSDNDAKLRPDQIWYKDADNDGHSDGTTATSCTRPAGYKAAAELLATSGDCNDNDANVRATRNWFRDADSDGFGDPNVTINACSQPGGYVVNNTDCNDANANIRPGAPEICNGIDDNCNGQIDDGAATVWYKDADGDGYSDGTTVTACARPAGYKLASELTATSGDCNDTSAALRLTMIGYADLDGDTYTAGGAQSFCTNGTLPAGYVAVRKGEDCNDASAAVYPGATEVCNGIDDNCDGQIDEGVKTTFYRDADGDTYGNPAVTTQACSAPVGYVANSTDCNDANAAVHPGATEVCNGIDDNCDGQIDEGVKTTFYRDADGDTYGNPAVTTQACAAPAGYVSNSTDCNDANAAVHPGAAEVCNGIDDNCDGQIDEGVKTTFYRDVDGDGYGASGDTTQACTVPAGYVANSTDCNDANGAVHPGATEICNSIDDNCDTVVDEGVKTTFYRDVDGDGYGASGDTTQACSAPAGYVSNSTDCNDANAAIHPGATEVCNGVDDDCDTQIDEGLSCAPSCNYSGFTAGGGSTGLYVAAQDVSVHKATTTTGFPFDGLMVEIYRQRVPGGVYPGSYAIPADTSPATSHTVVIVDYSCGAMPGTCTKSFLATGGTVNITSYGGAVGQTLAGSLSNVVLKEAVIAPDRTVTLVPGGQVWCIDSYSFSNTLQGPAPPGPPVVSGIQLVSYGWPPTYAGFEGFKFSTASKVSNAQEFGAAMDFYVEWNSIWLGDNVGILSLGSTVTLADVTAVPSTGYVSDGWSIPPFNGNPPSDVTGYVYALKLADGTYAAIQFAQFGYDPTGTGEPLYATFSYKYPLTATPPPPSNVVTGTTSLVNRDTYDNDAFIFSTQQVVADDGTFPWDGPADIAVKGSSLFFAAGGVQSLGEGTTLAATTSVPASGYAPAAHAGIYGFGISTGQVYALQLGNGKYAAIEFTEINVPNGTGDDTRCTFSYKYQTNGTTSLQ